METSQIEAIIKEKFPKAEIAVSGDGYHFEAVIVSDAFIGKSRVQQQQMIYSVLNPYILDGRIHAITLKTEIPK